MFLAEPARTPYDLSFVIAGFPIRVSAYFWLGALVLGAQLLQDLPTFFIWVVSLFISILIHELGHAVAFRYFGQEAHIVLYHFGGLAIPGRDSFSSYGNQYSGGNRSDRLQSQFIIAFAGPAAGFLLAGLVLLAIQLSGGKVTFDLHGFPFDFLRVQLDRRTGEHLRTLVGFLLYINIYWGLMNLLPVFPLDGGQMARAVFLMQDPWGGNVKSLWLSLITASGVAIASLAFTHNPFLALLFGSLALSSYLAIQQLGGGRPW